MINIEKTETLSMISRDLGQIFFASAFLGPLLSGDGADITMVIGLVFALFSWYCALILAKN